ncbi:hypothetical protein REPUB_Repub07fG0086400 [Reevesia pubescens]
MMQIVRGGRVLWLKYSAAPPASVASTSTNIVRRGRSYAASPSEAHSLKRKKVSKDQRRALIQSFVSRYRSMNAGKFPPPSVAKKEVGGSYYVVKKVLQELEYESKLSSSNSSYENLSGKVINKEDKSFSAVEVVSTAVGVQDDTSREATDDVKMLDTNDKQLEADRVLQAYTSAEEIFSEVVLKPHTPGSHCDFVLEDKSVLKGDAMSLEKQKDDKVEDAGLDSSYKFLTVPDKEKIVESDQYLESEECKMESKGVQSDFGDAKSLEKQENDKLEDAGIDSSDRFLTVPDKEKIVEASDQHLETEECKTESKGVQSHFGGIQGDLLKEETEIGSEEGDNKEQMVSKELLKSGSPEHKAERQQQFTEEDKYGRNLASEQTDDAESSKKSNLWRNLKSLADGIINMWRKL